MNLPLLNWDGKDFTFYGIIAPSKTSGEYVIRRPRYRGEISKFDDNGKHRCEKDINRDLAKYLSDRASIFGCCINHHYYTLIEGEAELAAHGEQR